MPALRHLQSVIGPPLTVVLVRSWTHPGLHRVPNPDPDSWECGNAKARADVPQTIVATMGASQFQSNTARFQVEIVVYDQ